MHVLLLLLLLLGTAARGELVLHVVTPSAAVSAASATPDGSRAAPYQSVGAARDALRRHTAAGGLPDGGATVLLHAGHHAPFALNGPLDSGRTDAPIVYAAAPGERAVVSGGVSLPQSAFEAWASGPAGALVADLGQLGVTSSQLGAMRTPKMGCISDCQHDKAELYLGSQAMTLARYPNKAADGSWQFLHAEVGSGSTWFLMNASDPTAARIRKCT